MQGYVKFILSIIGGILTLLITLTASYFLNLDNPKTQTFSVIGIVIIASILVGILMRGIEYLGREDDDNYRVVDIFIKALYMPLMVGITMIVLAGLPVLMGILPPKFQSFPGEGMGILGIFRGIPESMSPVVGEKALPIAEMFYAFWGGLYGMTIV